MFYGGIREKGKPKAFPVIKSHLTKFSNNKMDFLSNVKPSLSLDGQKVLGMHTIMYFFGLYDNHLSESWVYANLFALFVLILTCTQDNVKSFDEYGMWFYLWSIFNDCVCLRKRGEVDILQVRNTPAEIQKQALLSQQKDRRDLTGMSLVPDIKPNSVIPRKLCAARSGGVLG
ncbi:hypothetical protein CYMTET_30262 [Cymbomonas tetramitiformis]|uniref:Uncharacterized protein n=1 Tax=Cymbomonas tetramitiformis TaxID=36881 RepID=A0AAE0FJD2_9CHLO|nr:hypothetical protein CYMTET_30262 [Cymbomonas tetramitiformis]